MPVIVISGARQMQGPVGISTTPVAGVPLTLADSEGVTYRATNHPVCDFYVDSVNGLDTNSGTSIDEPLKTIAALLAKTLTDGVRIGLARNSHWDEQLTLAVNNPKVVAYGFGAKPILDASDAVAANGWTKTGGQTVVYQATVTISALAAKTWVRAWENGTTMLRATSVANCNATANSYYPSADTNAGDVAITLYVHASDGSDPAASGKVYSYSHRQYGLISSSAKTGAVVSGIETRCNLHEDGSLVVGRNSTIVESIAREGSKHNLLVWRGATLRNVKLVNAYYANAGAAMFVQYDTDGGGVDSTLTNVTASNSSSDTNIGGFHSESAGANFGTITYTNCSGTLSGHIFSLSGATNYVLNNPTASATGGTSFAASLVKGSSLTIVGGTLTAAGTSTVNMNDVANARLSISASTAIANSHAAYPNLIYGTGASAVITLADVAFSSTNDSMSIYVTGATNSLTMNRCTMGNSVKLLFGIGTGDTYVGDYNTYHAAAQWDWNNSWVNFATWKTNTGQDAHSTM